MESPGQKEKEGTNDSGISSYGKAMRTAGPLFTAGLQMAISICIMGFVGYWLDGKFDTTPWLMVVGIVFGAAAGMYQFIKIVTSLEKKNTDSLDNKN